MIDIARRLEYIFLKKTSRPNIGKFVATEIVSCQLHDSNLINVQLSRTLRVLDLGKPDPLNPTLNPAVDEIGGNKATECWSMNTARFLAGAMKKSKDWKAFMLYRYGYKQGIPSVKSARFWAVMIIMGTYLYKNMKYIKEFAHILLTPLVHRDIFQEARRRELECSETRQELNEAKRRVRKAPVKYTICDPPSWYTGFWTRELTKRARSAIALEWASQDERAAKRWKTASAHAAWASQDEARKADTREGREETITEMCGGLLDLSSDELAEPLQLIDIDQFDSVGNGISDSSVTKWTNARIANQLKLRNLERYLEPRQRNSASVLVQKLPLSHPPPLSHPLPQINPPVHLLSSYAQVTRTVRPSCRSGQYREEECHEKRGGGR
jgi:hypothetical protein